MKNKNKLVDLILKTNVNTFLKNLDKNSLYYENSKSRNWCPFCNDENTFIHKNVWRSCSGDYEDIAIIIYDYETWGNKEIYDKKMKNAPKEVIKIHKAECAYDNQHIIHYVYSINTKGKIFKFAEWPNDLILIRKKMPSWINTKIVKKIDIDKFLKTSYKSFQEKFYLGAYFYLRRFLKEIVLYVAKINNFLPEIKSSKSLGRKIEKIKQFLPEFIKKNIKTFSNILNNSIHTWNEQEAKENWEEIIVFIKNWINKLKESEKEIDISKKLNSLVNPRKKQ